MKHKQPVILGRKAWIARANVHAWPEGCPDGTEVTILGNNLETTLVTISDQHGEEWELDAAHLDTGWLYKIGARYYHESTPQAREHLTEMIERRQSLSDASSDLHRRVIDECHRILRRNEHELSRTLAA